ncbi:MAG: hypothetical protein AAGH38_00475 [Pseudomonadota bacterium]
MPGAEARDEFVEYEGPDARAKTVRRLNVAQKMLRKGQITATQYAAGEHVAAVFDACTPQISSMYNAIEAAPCVGGTGDPINRFEKAPTGFRSVTRDGKTFTHAVEVPSTQKPRQPKRAFAVHDGLTARQAQAINDYVRMTNVLDTLERRGRFALVGVFVCNQTIGAITREIGYQPGKQDANTLKALMKALDDIDAEYSLSALVDG